MHQRQPAQLCPSGGNHRAKSAARNENCRSTAPIVKRGAQRVGAVRTPARRRRCSRPASARRSARTEQHADRDEQRRRKHLATFAPRGEPKTGITTPARRRRATRPALTARPRRNSSREHSHPPQDPREDLARTSIRSTKPPTRAAASAPARGQIAGGRGGRPPSARPRSSTRTSTIATSQSRTCSANEDAQAFERAQPLRRHDQPAHRARHYRDVARRAQRPGTCAPGRSENGRPTPSRIARR